MNKFFKDPVGKAMCLLATLGLVAPALVKVINVLIILFEILFYVGIVGLVIYGIFQLVQYNQRTGELSRMAENITCLLNGYMEGNRSITAKGLQTRTIDYLPAPEEDPLLLEKLGNIVLAVENLKDTIKQQENQISQLDERISIKTKEFVEQALMEKEKEDLDFLT